MNQAMPDDCVQSTVWLFQWFY